MNSKSIPYFEVLASTNRLFARNPAGVCTLKERLPDAQLQAVAAQDDLPETAFMIERKDFRSALDDADGGSGALRARQARRGACSLPSSRPDRRRHSVSNAGRQAEINREPTGVIALGYNAAHSGGTFQSSV